MNKTEWLRSRGFIVGERDPRINTNHPGRFMVVEEYDESDLPTRDASRGPWAIVGDCLEALVDEAFEVFSGEETT